MAFIIITIVLLPYYLIPFSVLRNSARPHRAEMDYPRATCTR